MHRVHGRGPVALLEPLPRRLGDCRRKLDVDAASHRVSPDEKAGLTKDGQHLVVLREHLGLEGPDAAVGRELRELADEDRAQPLPLARIGDREAHLGTVVADPREFGVTHDALLATSRRDQSEPACVFDVRLPMCLPHQRVVAQVTAVAEPARLS